MNQPVMFQQNSKQYFGLKTLIKIVLLSLTYLTLFRLAFFVWFRPDEVFKNIEFVHILKSFYLGGKFDLRLVLLSFFPLLIYSFFLRLNLFKFNKISRFVILFYICVTNVLFSFIYLIDLGTYSYINTRINSTILKFLNNPMISLQMVWQSYPVMWAMLFLAVIFVLTYYILHKRVIPHNENYYYIKRTLKKSLLPIPFFFLIWAAGIYGKFSFYPLRWSEAFYSMNHFISNLALNPILYFYDTLKIENADVVDMDKVNMYAPYVENYLGATNNDLSLKRDLIPQYNHPIQGRPNVVVILLESLSAHKTGSFGNKIDPTPALDALVKESVLFDRFYVPSQATARSIFSIVTGVPDLTSKKSASRNPHIVKQHTVVNYLEEYEKFYFLGGSANWGNIRGIFTHNIKDIQIKEEGHYSSPRVDVWGISDLNLFKEANEVFKKAERSEKPFFAFIQSSGFHRPYTIPDDHGDFKVATDISTQDLKDNGFISLAEYNSLKFQDYALGSFFELAKKEKYYENTIFVVLGDHGLPSNGTSLVPKSYSNHYLECFHVPLVIHGPKFFTPKVIHTVGSELDVFPTVAGLLNIPYSNTSFGRDLFDPRFHNDRKAFVYYWYKRPAEFGMFDGEYFYRGNLEKDIGLFHVKNRGTSDIRQKNMDKFNELKNLAHGFYHLGRYKLFHNKTEKLN